MDLVSFRFQTHEKEAPEKRHARLSGNHALGLLSGLYRHRASGFGFRRLPAQPSTKSIGNLKAIGLKRCGFRIQANLKKGTLKPCNENHPRL